MAKKYFRWIMQARVRKYFRGKREVCQGDGVAVRVGQMKMGVGV